MHTAVRDTAIALAGLAGLMALAAPALGQTRPPPYNPHPVLGATFGSGGTDQFSATDDTDSGQLCYMLVAADVQNPTGAFIGEGKSNTSVLALQPPVNGTSGACVNIGQDLAKKLVDHASDYSVYVQNRAYPQGMAAEGRLTAQIPDRPIT